MYSNDLSPNKSGTEETYHFLAIIVIGLKHNSPSFFTTKHTRKYLLFGMSEALLETW